MSLCWEFSYIYSLRLVYSSRKEFEKFPIGGKGGRFELLKQMNTCFVCFGNHPQQKCPNKKLRLLCGSENTTFSCASPKRIPKMIFIHIPRQQVMRHKKLSCKYLIIHSPQLLASWPCPLPNRRSKGV